MVSNAQSMRSIEDGTLDMHVAPFDPRAAVRALLQVCRLGCAQSNISWASEAEPMPALVEADRSFFCQILQNLVTNATRFQDERGVAVRVSCAAGGGTAAVEGFTSPPTHTLEATVADCGCGLSPHDCARVFEAYEAAPTARGGQSGLGLFISRTCARRAGGDLTVVSAGQGQGATFTLRFPVHVPAAAAAEWAAAVQAWAAQTAPGLPPPATVPAAAGSKRAGSPRTSGGAHKLAAAGAEREPRATAAPPPPPPRLRCLLVDDHALNLKLVQRLLEQHGFAVETGANGHEAFDKLVAAFEAGAPPSIAIIDMQMPVWSGPDAARAWRAWEAQHRPGGPRLPLLCLTANVMEENREECEAAGFDGFLPKPLRAADLAELRERAAAYAQQLEAAAGGGSSSA
jgi:CheY-like chemotaxis protein